MARYVAFLRGINLGKRRPPMAHLKALFEELGMEDVATFIASGNVIFSCRATDRAKIEQKISQHLHKSLGYEVETFVRTAEEVIAIGSSTPFREELKGSASVQVCLLHEPLEATDVRKLTRIRTDIDEFAAKGRELYWLCRTRTTESTVWQDERMKTLELPSFTMRNMTSIRKLIAQRLS